MGREMTTTESLNIVWHVQGARTGLFSPLFGSTPALTAVPVCWVIFIPFLFSFLLFLVLYPSQKRMGREITTMESLSLGAIAGLVSALTTYPLELARKEINMSLLPMSATRTGGYRKYNTMVQALRGIVKSRGVYWFVQGRGGECA